MLMKTEEDQMVETLNSIYGKDRYFRSRGLFPLPVYKGEGESGVTDTTPASKSNPSSPLEEETVPPMEGDAPDSSTSPTASSASPTASSASPTATTPSFAHEDAPAHDLPAVDSLFLACCDGILLCRMFNEMYPGAVPDSKLSLDSDITYFKTKIVNRSRRLDPATRAIFQITQNLNSLRGALHMNPILESQFCISVNDLIHFNYEPVILTLKAFFRAYIVSRVTVANYPFLTRIKDPSEPVATFSRLSAETMILRWVNYTLRASGSKLQIKNLSSDLKDSEAFLNILLVVAPESMIDRATLMTAINLPPAKVERHATVIDTLNKMGCCMNLAAKDIFGAERTILVPQLALLFAHYPGLSLPDENEVFRLQGEVRDLNTKLRELEQHLHEATGSARYGKQASEDLERTKALLKEARDELEILRVENPQLKLEIENLRAYHSKIKEQFEQQKNQNMGLVDDRLQTIQRNYTEMIEERDHLIEDLQKKMREMVQQQEDERQKFYDQLRDERMKAREDILGQVSGELEKEREAEAERIKTLIQTREEEEERDREEREKAREERDKAREEREQEKAREREEKEKEKEARQKEKEERAEERARELTDIKQQLADNEKKLARYADLVKDLEEELEEERKAFDDLLDFQKGQSKDNNDQAYASFNNRREAVREGKAKGTEQVLLDTLKELINALGANAEAVLGELEEDVSTALKVSYLVSVLIDVKTALDKKVAELQYQLKKNDEINDIMKRKVESFVLKQMEQKKKFTRHHFLF